MANFNQMMKQAQALQRKMAAATEELAEREVTGSAGGGMVTATATGTGVLKQVKIAPEVVDPDEVEMLEDMVTAAITEALRSAKALEEDTMGELTGGLGLPPGLM
ncbi:MAG: YbaB/EbfC family nucleoid-associated protein [Euzebyales bacterium]|jgi:DNA-binding YbaB/EbfC family protein|nr:YbaB/EbfC family nucleoid-associated protein [Euzebyales bacterium]